MFKMYNHYIIYSGFTSFCGDRRRQKVYIVFWSLEFWYGICNDVKRTFGYDWLFKMGRRSKKQSNIEFAI